jgi:hypothetical protein
MVPKQSGNECKETCAKPCGPDNYKWGLKSIFSVRKLNISHIYAQLSNTVIRDADSKIRPVRVEWESMCLVCESSNTCNYKQGGEQRLQERDRKRTWGSKRTWRRLRASGEEGGAPPASPESVEDVEDVQDSMGVFRTLLCSAQPLVEHLAGITRACSIVARAASWGGSELGDGVGAAGGNVTSLPAAELVTPGSRSSELVVERTSLQQYRRRR